MKIERTKHRYDAYIRYTITDNICTICANNPTNIDNNPYLLGGRVKCAYNSESVCECDEFKNYNNIKK